MQIADLLTLENIVVDLKANSKSDLLLKLSKLATSRVPIAEAEIIRSAYGSRGIGLDRHGRAASPCLTPVSSRVASPVGIFVRLERPIDFDAVDAAPVDLVFLLLLPDFPNSVQLPALACVARGLRDPLVSTGVRKARSKEQVFAAISAIG